MKTVKGVKKYAKQFLKTVDLKDVPLALEQMSSIAGLMERDKKIKNLLVSPLFTEEEKALALAGMGVQVKMSHPAIQFLVYLSKEHVIGGLQAIIRSINAQYLEMKKMARAVVTAAAPVGREFEQQLLSSLKQATGRDIEVEYVIDPGLLGGVRIQVGSTMYDTSIRGQLGLLKDKLIKG